MIAIEQLVASALGELPADADAEVEVHVLSCGRCASLYAAFLRLGPAIADLVRGAGTVMPVTRALVERLDAEGLISRRYELRAGAVVPCAVGPTDIYSLTTYHVELAGVTRVDLIRGGQRVPDVPFDADAGRVYMLTRSDALRALPSMRLALRLVAVDAAGERTLGEYALDHTAGGG
jgi:hypothetical protein